jgi:hypothetical protein
MLIGKSMERVGVSADLIRGLGLDRTITMVDDMSAEVKLDQEDVLKLIAGLSDDNADRVLFWIGAAIRDLAKS